MVNGWKAGAVRLFSLFTPTQRLVILSGDGPAGPPIYVNVAPPGPSLKIRGLWRVVRRSPFSCHSEHSEESRSESFQGSARFFVGRRGDLLRMTVRSSLSVACLPLPFRHATHAWREMPATRLRKLPPREAPSSVPTLWIPLPASRRRPAQDTRQRRRSPVQTAFAAPVTIQ